MSCFIVANSCIDRIAAYVATLPTDAAPRVTFASILDCEPAAPDFAERFAVALAALNRAAFTTRYEGRYPEDVGVYTFHVADASAAVALKDIQCLIYQCSEGDIPKTLLYRALAALESQVGELLARTNNLRKTRRFGEFAYDFDSVPAYKAASWGDDNPAPPPPTTPKPTSKIIPFPKQLGLFGGAR